MCCLRALKQSIVLQQSSGSEASMGIYYIATLPGGIANYDKTTVYSPGAVLIHPDPELSNAECGRGFHVCKEIQQTKEYLDHPRAEYYRVEVDDRDILAAGDTKTRVRKLKVIERFKPEALLKGH